MMKQMFKLALVAIMGMTMTSCMSVNFGNDKDSTPTQVSAVNQVTPMQPFDEVDIAGAFKVIYSQSEGEHSVSIEASEQQLKEMTVYVKEGELRIRKAVAKPTSSFKNVKIHVTSPDLKKIELAGSGVFTASNAISSNNDLDVDLAGSGNVLLTSVSCADSDLEIAGSGNIEIGHLQANETTAEIAGSGNVNLGELICKELKAEIAGSGDVNCDYIDADNVRAEIAGSGNVNLKGAVRNHTKEIAGSGSLNIVEAPSPDKIQ